MLVVTTAAAGGLTGLVAPAASAAPDPRPAAERWAPPRCKPVHEGRDWRWDDRGRHGGHWDHREWNRKTHKFEWKHIWRDDRRCEPQRRGWDNGGNRERR